MIKVGSRQNITMNRKRIHFWSNPNYMMKYTLIPLFTITLLIFSLVTASAQTASVTEGCAPLVVEFSAPTGLDNFFWDFKNGNNSSLTNPTETFQEPGVYVVEFSLGLGLPVQGTVTITVYAKPELDFAADPAGGCAPLPVQFSNDSQIDPAISDAGISWNWNFGDGQTAQTETTSHTYSTAGSYNVTLQLISSVTNCSVVETELDFINISSVEAAFITEPLPATSCEAPLTVNFINQTAGENLTFDWDFGNGEASAAISPGAVTYTQEGEDEVLLTVTDENGCVGSTIRTVTVGTPTADFTIPDTICMDQPIQLVNNSTSGSYVWTFGPKASPTVSTAITPEVTFNEPGDTDIRLVVTSLDGGCTNEITKSVFVQAVDASFVTDPSFLCSDPFEFTYQPALSDENATYSWLFSDSTTSSEMIPTYPVPVDPNIYAETGVREIQTELTLTSSAGCTATFFRTDTVFQAYSLFMPDIDNGCAPLTVTFSDSSSAFSNIVSYTYLYGDGNSETFDNDVDHSYTFTEAGEYDVLLVIEDALGCTDTSYAVRIEVGEPIVADFAADAQTVCPGELVTLNTTTTDDRIDAWHFDTDDGRSSHCYNEDELIWSFATEAKEMDVTLTVEYNGCFSELTKQNFINVQGPIANLYYEMECEAPFEYTFRDSSFNASSVSWDFGDGNTGAGAEVVHTYAETGDYWVKLTAENPGTGCIASVDSALVCVRNPEAKFELDPMICMGTQVDLDGSESVDVNADCWKGYTWFFEISGRPITTQDSSIEWSFSNPGMETVMLEVEDINGCKDTTTVMTQIYDIQAQFEVDKSRICVPGEVVFTDLSTADTLITKWEWMFGDGAGMSTDQNPAYTYTSLAGVPPGEGITVTLSIEDELGCTGEATQTISVYEPTSTINASDLTICAGETVDFTASDFTQEGSNLLFSWDLGNGESSTDQSVSTTYDAGGTYDVVLDFVENATGCIGQTNARVEVQEFPDPMVTIDVADPENICVNTPTQFLYDNAANQVLTYNWAFSDGQSSTAEDPQLTFSERGAISYVLEISTSFGCAATTSGDFDVVGPDGDFTFSPAAFCVGDEVTFNLVDTSGVNSWEFTFGDGESAENESPVTHVFENVPTTGTRTVSLVLRDDNGCEFNPDPQTLFIGGAPVEVADGFACAGDTITLSAGDLRPGSTYSWAPADNIINPNSPNPRAVVSETTTFTVTITSSLGCISEDSGTITVVPLVNFAGQNIVSCDDGPVTLPEPENPNGIYTFTWLPEGPVVTPEPNAEVTTVILRVSDEANCNDSNAFEFNITLAENSFRIPNVFTPDGDDLNDEFKVFTAEGTNLNITIFKVYNRWGKVVYDGSGAGDPSWNGQVDGEPSPSEVYTYFIEIEIPQCEAPIQRKGDLTLLR